MKTEKGFLRFEQPIALIALVGIALVAPRAVSRADTIYVANGGNNTIELFAADGSRSVFANSGLNNPFGLAFDTAGNLYAANINNNTIQKFTPGGSGSLFASSGLAAPWGLAFDKQKFTPDGTASVFANTGLNLPTSIAIIPEPASLAMLALGLFGFAVLRYKASVVSRLE